MFGIGCFVTEATHNQLGLIPMQNIVGLEIFGIDKLLLMRLSDEHETILLRCL